MKELYIGDTVLHWRTNQIGHVISKDNETIAARFPDDYILVSDIYGIAGGISKVTFIELEKE